VINFAIARVAAAGDAVRQLLTPATRERLAADVIEQLGGAIAYALRDVYLTAAVAAVLALICTFLLPAGLSLRRSSERR